MIGCISLSLCGSKSQTTAAPLHIASAPNRITALGIVATLKQRHLGENRANFRPRINVDQMACERGERVERRMRGRRPKRVHFAHAVSRRFEIEKLERADSFWTTSKRIAYAAEMLNIRRLEEGGRERANCDRAGCELDGQRPKRENTRHDFRRHRAFAAWSPPPPPSRQIAAGSPRVCDLERRALKATQTRVAVGSTPRSPPHFTRARQQTIVL